MPYRSISHVESRIGMETKEHGAPSSKQRFCKMPKRFTGSAVDETVGHRSQTDTQTLGSIILYNKVIDCIISELDRRFSDHSRSVIIGEQALTPRGF